MANKENIAYLSDMDGVATKPEDAVQGNLPIFGPGHALLDSGKKPSDFVTQAGVDAAVGTATAEIWNVVTGVAAFAAYQSLEWSAATTYAVGAYCRHVGQGYRCTVAHVSGASFDPSNWRLVLTSGGKAAIDTLLESFSRDGLAQLVDLAPAYNGNRNYTVGMLAVKDGVLQVCTRAGRGPAADFSPDATVEDSIAARLEALADRIPTNVSELENDAQYVSGPVVDAEYDTSGHGYAVGDTCTHAAKFYVCVRTVAVGSEWNPSDWSEKSLKELVAGWAVREQADWNETDENKPGFIRNKPTIPGATQADWNENDAQKPGFIRNKPTIPTPVTVDATLTQSGAAADAQVVGQRLAGALSLDKLPYKITSVSAKPQTDPSVLEFQLNDRTVNLITATIPNGVSISLIPPQRPTSAESGVVLARDFYVVLNLSAVTDIAVSVQRASVQDVFGQSVTPIMAGAGKVSVFRLMDSDRGQNAVFLITGFGDSTHGAVHEIERALDDILRDYGIGVFTPGVYLQDDVDPARYHKITIWTDGETGSKELGVDQEGIIK